MAGNERSVTKPIYAIFHEIDPGPDLMFMGPTSKCACGCEVFHALVWFSEEKTIAGYFTEMVCAGCGALVRGVTEADS